MAKDFEIDLTPLLELIQRSPEDAGRGGKQAMDDIKDDWIGKARDIAPIAPKDGGNLRIEIHGEVKGDGLDSNVIVTANATQSSDGKWKDFNYGYYIHEGHMAQAGKSLQTQGTSEKFLDDSANEDKWKQWLEEEIKNQLRQGGW